MTVSDAPRRVLLLGHPVAHSFSPHFQNAAIRHAGIDAQYTAIDVAPTDLAAVVRSVRAESAAGNVTVPHKREMLGLCDNITSVARRALAVNTFWMRDGKLWGDNTDVPGFNAAVRALLGREPSRERVLVLGAGGAAAAVLTAIEDWEESRALLLGRNTQACELLAARFAGVASVARSDADPAACTLVVNATPIGLHGDSFDNNPASAAAGAAVLDLAYAPSGTPLVRSMLAQGRLAADGREMLLEQGALAFVRWFGVEPNRMIMRAALEEAING